MKVLLVNPPYESVYRNSKVKEGVPQSPVLSLATISANLRKNHKVLVYNANISI